MELPIGRFSFPHHTSRTHAVQPDYVRWQAVSVGMSRDEVVALLGPPHEDDYSAPQPTKDGPYYHYGYLELGMMPHPRTYQFLVGFDETDRVSFKEDPFDGVFSPDGLPTKPTIFTPPDGASFAHFPRIVDMRWHPVSGRYPMWYEVELGHGLLEREGPFCDEPWESDLPFPYCVAELGGSQFGRFRVRGRNELGVGEWSDHRYFDFMLCR